MRSHLYLAQRLLTPVLVSLLVLLASRVDARGYTFVTLDHPAVVSPGSFIFITGINDSGDAVGYYSIQSQYFSFVYSGGTYTPLTLSGSAPGTIRAYGINDSGQIAGSYYLPDHGIAGFRYSGGGDGGAATYTTYIDPFQNDATLVRGINDNGDVVGYYENGYGGFNSFVNVGGTFSPVDPPSMNAAQGGSSYAVSINDHGDVAGSYHPVNNVLNTGFFYDGTSYTDINGPAASNLGMYIYGINDSDVMAGYYYESVNRTFSFLYSNGVYTPIDEPDSGPLGTYVTGISNNGNLSGYYYDNNGKRHGFIALNGIVVPEAGTGWLYLLGFGLTLIAFWVQRNRTRHKCVNA